MLARRRNDAIVATKVWTPDDSKSTRQGSGRRTVVRRGGKELVERWLAEHSNSAFGGTTPVDGHRS
ncbi:hypothetical protein BH24ACT6_BH24ACT6_10920 [soil metagenome]